MKVRASDVVSGLRFKFRIQARCSSCCLRLLRPRQVAPPCQVYVYRVRGAAPQRHRHVCLTGRCTGEKLGVRAEDQLAGVGIVFQDKGREGMRIEHCLPNGLHTHTHTGQIRADFFVIIFYILFFRPARLLEALSLAAHDRLR